ncbi:MAG TPA: GNAT family N-acetyltransferase [Anaerolineae bacterium]|nr:GNAT family N-acetyltransferase [Anaerolineae bacterium]
MKISAFDSRYLSHAVALFTQNFEGQRRATPSLPDRLEKPKEVSSRLGDLFQRCGGVMAVEGDRLIGYLGWFIAERFRENDRRGAYVPEWGHAAIADRQPEIYPALYRAAAEQWNAAGCGVHALTLLAHDRAAQQTWFWNGFGLIVVDAVRPLQPLAVSVRTDLAVRQATLADVSRLAALDAEHWQHYTRSPIFMTLRTSTTADRFAEFLARPKNSVWLALDGETPIGFIRYEGYDFDGAAMVESDRTIGITGAYVQPAYRGRKAAVALLDAALRRQL